jgi:CspA family cold shock protein
VREGRERKHVAQGTVKWFSKEKGYGLITPDDGGEDLLVHYTGVRGTGFRALAEGQTVSYVLTHGRVGRARATNVTKV